VTDEPPAGYDAPLLVYLVEEADPAGEMGQLGGFLTERDAKDAQRRLEAEGREVRINMVPIHRRVEDWEYDR
jgi:hypothetical protein